MTVRNRDPDKLSLQRSRSVGRVQRDHRARRRRAKRHAGEGTRTGPAQRRDRRLRPRRLRRRARQVHRRLQDFSEPQAVVQHRPGQPRSRTAGRGGGGVRSFSARRGRRPARDAGRGAPLGGRAQDEARPDQGDLRDRWRRDHRRRQAGRQHAARRDVVDDARPPPGGGPARGVLARDRRRRRDPGKIAAVNIEVLPIDLRPANKTARCGRSWGPAARPRSGRRRRRAPLPPDLVLGGGGRRGRRGRGRGNHHREQRRRRWPCSSGVPATTLGAQRAF